MLAFQSVQLWSAPDQLQILLETASNTARKLHRFALGDISENDLTVPI
jgi:hypothetical protein